MGHIDLKRHQRIGLFAHQSTRNGAPKGKVGHRQICLWLKRGRFNQGIGMEQLGAVGSIGPKVHFAQSPNVDVLFLPDEANIRAILVQAHQSRPLSSYWIVNGLPRLRTGQSHQQSIEGLGCCASDPHFPSPPSGFVQAVVEKFSKYSNGNRFWREIQFFQYQDRLKQQLGAALFLQCQDQRRKYRPQ